MRYAARVVITVCLGLAACGEGKPPRVEDTVFDAQVKALEKGREVEQALQQAEQRRREALEHQERGAAP